MWWSYLITWSSITPNLEAAKKSINPNIWISIKQKIKHHKQNQDKLEKNNYNTYHKKGLVSLVCKELQTNKKVTNDGTEKWPNPPHTQ